MKIALVVLFSSLSAWAPPTNKLYWPTSNTQVTICAHMDHAGKDWKCGSNRYDGHRGTAFSFASGNALYAASNGVVTKSNDGCPVGYYGSTCGGGFGNHVVIFHSTGDTTIYGHMVAGSNIAGQGSNLGCGDRVGASGSSGNVTGPHLHFEVRTGASQGSPYSGTADDPYAGACSGPISFWASQGTGYVSSCGAGPSAPHPQAATTCGCPAGTYPLWNCNEAKTERVRCTGGNVQKEVNRLE